MTPRSLLRTLLRRPASAQPLPRSREEKIAQLRQLGPWFHQIDLGDGIRTRDLQPAPGPQAVDHPRDRWAVLEPHLPASLAGLRLLDIGCSDGFFAVELARRGASEVWAADYIRAPIQRLRWLAQVLRLPNIQANVFDIYRLPEDLGRFDYGFMLALLYHLEDPLRGLRIVSELTDRLFLETVVEWDEEHAHLLFRPPIPGAQLVHKWVPTTRCVKDMLAAVGYTKVTELSRPDDKRGMYYAERG